MFDRDRRQRATPDQAGMPGTSLELARTRASLRLLFDAAEADRIARRSQSGPSRLYAAAARRWTLAQWQDRLFQSDTEPTDRAPLAPASGLTARGAVVLALHLGFQLGAEELADAASVSAAQIGLDLYRTRATLASGSIADCGEYSASLGRYRDRTLDISSRASLLHHLQHCDACRAAVDRFQSIDALLLEQIEHESALLADANNLQDRSAGRIVWIAALSTLLVAVLIVGGFLLNRSRSTVQSPAITSSADTQLSGWLLTQDNGGQVTAVNLETGQRHQVGPLETQPPDPRLGAGLSILSPDKQLIARQEPVAQPQLHVELTILGLDGSIKRTIEFHDRIKCILSGWLGNDTILEVEQPSQDLNQPIDSYLSGLQTDSTVVAINVVTGEQHQMFRGSVQAIYPSPDQSMVVMSTWKITTGVSRQIELRPIQHGQIGNVVASMMIDASAVPFWAPDSSRFFVAGYPDNQATPEATSSPVGTPLILSPNLMRTALVSRLGVMTMLAATPDGLPSYPVSVSPDGRYLFELSEVFNDAAGTSHAQIWRTTLAGQETIPVTASAMRQALSGIWSPDGQTFMLQNSAPFLLTPSKDNSGPSGIWSVSMEAILPNGDVQLVNSQLGTSDTNTFLGWLAPNAFPQTEGHTPGGISRSA